MPSDRAVPSFVGNDFQRRLGVRLRAVRHSQGLRLQDVESRSRGQFRAVVVGSYERGDRAIATSKLAALAAFYGVATTELLPDDGVPTRRTPDRRLALAINHLAGDDDALEPLRRLVAYVQWLRGDYNGRVLTLRGDDLWAVAAAVGVEPDHIEAWLGQRDLICR